MRTYRGLFARLTDRAFLRFALTETTRGKRRRPDAAWLLFNAEAELDTIHRRLRDGSWRPCGLHILHVRDPKPRAIAVAPVADRVVYAALGILLQEVWEPRLLPEDMACRPGYGTHRARLALQRHLRAHRHCVHLDIRSYFPSVDLDVLGAILARRIRDHEFLDVLDRVLVNGGGILDQAGVREFLGAPPDWPPPGRGLPVGAYTSQVLATHVYLNDLDHFVKRELKVPGYVRYVDDLFLFGDRRSELRRWRQAVARWLGDERHVRLKHPAAPILSGTGTLDGLGARIRRDQILPGPRALERLRCRIRQHLGESGERAEAAFRRSVASSVGQMMR